MRWKRVVIPAAVGSVVAGAGAAAVGFYAMRKLGAALLHPSLDLRDKVVVITGGSRGLGLAMACEFGRCGSRVAICARDPHELEQAARKISRTAREAASFVCDITDREQVTSLVRQVVERFGRIDILINNAGEIRVAPFDSLDRPDYEVAMAAMFWGPVDMTIAALPQMRRQGAGVIVNIASVGGRVAVPRLLPYCCAKFALTGFSQGISAELAREHIHVLTVMPGLMRTGSYLQAQFKGEAEHEFTWFGLAANMPGLSAPASYAARRIRRAVERGRHTLVLTWPAKMLIRMEALLPELMAHFMSGVNDYVLPHPSAERRLVTGKVLNENFKGVFRLFTTLGRSAASELNQSG